MNILLSFEQTTHDVQKHQN